MASSWVGNPTDKKRLLLKHQRLGRRFRCEDNNVAFMNVQPHYYRVRQVEPCHHLGWSSQALILSILALGAMPKHQQQQQQQRQLSTKGFAIKVANLSNLGCSWPGPGLLEVSRVEKSLWTRQGVTMGMPIITDGIGSAGISFLLSVLKRVSQN